VRLVRSFMVTVMFGLIFAGVSAAWDFYSIHFRTGITAKASWVDPDGSSPDFTASIVNHLGHTATITCDVSADPARASFTVASVPDAQLRNPKESWRLRRQRRGQVKVSKYPDIHCREG
jgi:hypothetical protein